MSKILIYRIPETTSRLPDEILNREKDVLVLTHQELTPAQSGLLGKILNAVRLTIPEDVHMVAILPDSSIHFNDLITYTGVSKVIAFGLSDQDLNLVLEDSAEHIRHFEGFDLLFAPGLDRLLEDINAKRTLWNDLKRLFKL